MNPGREGSVRAGMPLLDMTLGCSLALCLSQQASALLLSLI